ncbi:MAG: homoserine kinase [Clostridia bacterium]|nr:homoserine kinase [Clostridia bacterium]
MYIVRVPATSANMGPGFDALGMAVTLYNELTAVRADAVSVEIEGQGAASLPRDEHNLVYQSYVFAMERFGHVPVPLFIKQTNHIPSARGLGSSSTAIVAGILLACAVSGTAVDRAACLDMAATLEGHPDNVAPAIYGGFTCSVMEGNKALCCRLEMPASLLPLAFIPDFELKTSQARAALPDSVPRRDAVFNLSRAAIITAAVAKGEGELLLRALEDKLHQPYRAPLVPGFEAFTALGKANGCGIYLSGAGPTVMALCPREKREALLNAFLSSELTAHWQALPLSFDNCGAQVETIDEP